MARIEWTYEQECSISHLALELAAGSPAIDGKASASQREAIDVQFAAAVAHLPAIIDPEAPRLRVWARGWVDGDKGDWTAGSNPAGVN